MKAVVDPSKSFESSVFGAEDLLRIFPELRPGGAGVLIEKDPDDDDLYWMVNENGKTVGDCCFFNREETVHLIVTDDDGNVIRLG